MEDCIFCQIIAGVAPASVVYSDEEIMVIMDIQPVNPGHALVIPKAHVAQLSELDRRIGGTMFQTAMRVAQAIRQTSTVCEGINLLLADGEVAGQEIFHVHLHIIPRIPGDGFRIKFGPHYTSKPDRKKLDKMSERIRETLHKES